MATKKIEKYGAFWPGGTSALGIEFACIQQGGSWQINGKQCGLGLKQHFLNARALIWPNRYFHKWVDLIYSEIIENMMTILMGPFSCGKTSIASEYVLIDYWCHPNNTMVLLSTTTVDKLKSAVFGEVSMLWKQGRERYPWLPGNLLDYKNAITTNTLVDADGEMTVRDMRLGCFGKACYEGSRYIGLGVYAGVKQERIRFLADELSFMASSFFDALPNMIGSTTIGADGEPQIKIIGSGNPKHDPFDQLGIAAEPVGGWASIGLVEKTSVWPTKFHRGKCVNLIGLDSPNFDVPADVPVPFPKLINRATIRAVEKRWDRNSLKFNEQCVGRMMIGFTGNRVITIDLCKNNKAFDKAIWKGTDRTRIGFVDPSWSSAGDRCIWGWLEFGEAADGSQIIRWGGYSIIPLFGGTKDDPDDQIAQFVKKEITALNILSTNIFYGSTGRGTTGAAFAKVFGMAAPVPIAEGGTPTERPVRHDLFVMDGNNKRHKRCDEEYQKFITELWFSTRNVIQSNQMRELPEEVAMEGCVREYDTTASGKIEVESKDELKEKLGYSPDLYDSFAFGVEGARQRGFQIRKLGETETIEGDNDQDYIDAESDRYRRVFKKALLEHV